MSATQEETLKGGMGRAYRNIRGMQEVGVLIALLVLCAALTFAAPVFKNPTNLLQVARQASYYGIMAVGMVFVICMGDIDLSVGSIFTLTNIVTGLALHAGLPVPIAILLGLGTGALCGLCNGLLAIWLRIPMIIVTLGTLSVFRGLALVLCKASPISQFPKDGLFFTVGGGDIAGIPTSVIVMVLLGIGGWIALTRSIPGRRLMAMGSSPLTARLSGVPLNRYRVVVMTINGTIAALAGIIGLAFLQSADPSTGTGFELWVIASVIIGGTALSGGRGSVPGAILGSLIIAVIGNGLILLNAPTYAATAITGAVIILAVAIDAFVKRRTQPQT
jgi:ribose transport system permease protein